MSHDTPRPTEYDVVIVGGGPSGASLGTLLARRGLSVVIIDKNEFPRPIPCGGMVSGRCARALEEVFGEEPLTAICRATSTGCRMFHSGQLIAEVSDCQTTFFVERSEMDALFLSIAKEAGCSVLEGTRAVGVDREESAIRLASGRTVRGAIIAGADGADSVVRKAVRGGRRVKRGRMAFGLVADVPFDRLKPQGPGKGYYDCPHIHFGILPWGYGWVFPKGDHLSMGVAGSMARTLNFRKSFDALVEAHCVSGITARLDVRGRRFPFGDFETAPGYKNVLLLGDAAGMVEPLTGDGIAFAVESALIAAPAIAEGLSRGRPSLAGRLYNSAYGKKLLPMLRHARLARWLFYPRPCMRRATRALHRHPELVRWYLEILAGNMTYPGYFRRMLSRPWRKGADVEPGT